MNRRVTQGVPKGGYGSLACTPARRRSRSTSQNPRSSPSSSSSRSRKSRSTRESRDRTKRRHDRRRRRRSRSGSSSSSSSSSSSASRGSGRRHNLGVGKGRPGRGFPIGGINFGKHMNGGVGMMGGVGGAKDYAAMASGVPDAVPVRAPTASFGRNFASQPLPQTNGITRQPTAVFAGKDYASLASGGASGGSPGGSTPDRRGSPPSGHQGRDGRIAGRMLGTAMNGRMGNVGPRGGVRFDHLAVRSPPSPTHGRDQFGRDQFGRDQFGRDQFGRMQFVRDQFEHERDWRGTSMNNRRTGPTPMAGQVVHGSGFGTFSMASSNPPFLNQGPRPTNPSSRRDTRSPTTLRPAHPTRADLVREHSRREQRRRQEQKVREEDELQEGEVDLRGTAPDIHQDKTNRERGLGVHSDRKNEGTERDFDAIRRSRDHEKDSSKERNATSKTDDASSSSYTDRRNGSKIAGGDRRNGDGRGDSGDSYGRPRMNGSSETVVSDSGAGTLAGLRSETCQSPGIGADADADADADVRGASVSIKSDSRDTKDVPEQSNGRTENGEAPGLRVRERSMKSYPRLGLGQGLFSRKGSVGMDLESASGINGDRLEGRGSTSENGESSSSIRGPEVGEEGELRQVGSENERRNWTRDSRRGGTGSRSSPSSDVNSRAGFHGKYHGDPGDDHSVRRSGETVSGRVVVRERDWLESPRDRGRHNRTPPEPLPAFNVREGHGSGTLGEAARRTASQSLQSVGGSSRHSGDSRRRIGGVGYKRPRSPTEATPMNVDSDTSSPPHIRHEDPVGDLNVEGKSRVLPLEAPKSPSRIEEHQHRQHGIPSSSSTAKSGLQRTCTNGATSNQISPSTSRGSPHALGHGVTDTEERADGEGWSRKGRGVVVTDRLIALKAEFLELHDMLMESEFSWEESQRFTDLLKRRLDGLILTPTVHRDTLPPPR